MTLHLSQLYGNVQSVTSIQETLVLQLAAGPILKYVMLNVELILIVMVLLLGIRAVVLVGVRVMTLANANSVRPEKRDQVTSVKNVTPMALLGKTKPTGHPAQMMVTLVAMTFARRAYVLIPIYPPQPFVTTAYGVR